MDISCETLENALQKYFGFKTFRGLQKDIIKTILSKQNTFVIMPTGGGKSMCYQLPALMLEGTAIVISPLIALMKNQVDAIRNVSTQDGVAHVLNSSLNRTEIQQVKQDISQGITKLLYMAPESLAKEEYVNFLKEQKISFLAVDEVHCISEWGHDFRPEYRNLRQIIKRIGDNIPIIGLTATATIKVQEDILKNLGITDAVKFKASFNRPNLYYEIRPKTQQIDADIIKFILQRKEKSGIIYCLSRKRVEELSQTLVVNGINAIPYHAGLDAKTRAKHQDMFLMEEINVVVATIAFGMGIDKPDVRYVIHHDIPKSLESYYQETGRAGRDGGEGHCLLFYAYKDIEKLEKFMSSKPLAEQEIGHALLQEMVAFAETSISRRKYILHYFGEEFDTETGLGGDMDDNVRNPKPQFEANTELKLLLETTQQTNQVYKVKDLVSTLRGIKNAVIISHKTTDLNIFGKGSYKDPEFWKALIRQALIYGYLHKEIETYGTLKLTDKGKKFIEEPKSFMMTLDHHYETLAAQQIQQVHKGNQSGDPTLMKILKKLRKEVAVKHNVPPFVVFQDNSLEDMTIKFPTTHEELCSIHGVGEGKSKRYGKPFIEFISKYVIENKISRPEDLVIKSTGAKSGLKLFIIQSIDRKIPLNDIADAKGIEMEDFISEMEAIVHSGTKLNISYWIDDILDEDQQEEVHDYFLEAEESSIEIALDEFDGDYEEEELRLYRIKFMSDVAN